MLNYIKHALNEMKTSDSPNGEKAKIVKNRIESLIYLLNYMVKCCEDGERKIFNRELKSFINILSQVNVGDSIFHSKTAILSLISKSSNTMSELLKSDKNPLKFHSKPITNELFEKYHNYNIFNNAQDCIIRKKMNAYLKKSKEAKEFCLKYMDTENTNVLKKKLSVIIMREKKRRLIGSFIQSNETKKAKKWLEEIKELTPDCIFKSGHHTTDTILSMSAEDNQRFLLLQLSFKASMRRRIHELINQKIHFLLNRIDKLKCILIEEDKFISNLWDSRNECETSKKHVKSWLCYRYLMEHDTRAATEMLLFDCMNVFGDKENRDLWIKANNLFTGINLRDHMAHCSPLVFRADVILDSRDFASALIDRMVEFIDDRETLVALLQLWRRQRKSTLNDFINNIKNEDIDGSNSNDTNRQLRLQEVIKNSERWERYAKLLSLEK